MNAFIKIYETDGAIGYFRGLIPRIARKGMGSIIAWSFYEYLIDKKDALIFSWKVVASEIVWVTIISQEREGEVFANEEADIKVMIWPNYITN